MMKLWIKWKNINSLVSFLPLFWVGLFIKIGLSLWMPSHFTQNFFYPFVHYFITSHFSNPWEHFYQLGRLDIFPYGSLMLCLLSAPLAFLKLLFPYFSFAAPWLQSLLIHLPILFFDYVILLVFLAWFPVYATRIVVLYWLSPILAFVSYFYGQLDVIPTAFLFISLYHLFRRNWFLSGIFIGAGISCKLHTLIFLPFVIAYMARNIVRFGNFSKIILNYFVGFLLVASLFHIPWIWNEAFRNMVFGTPEVLKLFQLKLGFDAHVYFYFAPAVLLVLYYRFIDSARINRDLLLMYLAFVFSVFVIFVPPRPSWYFWSVPFVVLYFIKNEKNRLFYFSSLNVFYLIFFGVLPIFHFHLDGLPYSGIVFSCLQASSLLMSWDIYKDGLKRQKFFQNTFRSCLIGVGGDSGAGKDTFCSVLKTTLGEENYSQNDGDDYHRWERGHEKWSERTHLDPAANHMMLSFQHMKELKSGSDIYKKQYDHSTGRFTETKIHRNNSFVVYSGLHTFYLEKVRNLLDLKIYLHPEEKLKYFWKIQRDMKKRGYSKEQVLTNIQKRISDYENYIVPQMSYADWVIRYQIISGILDDFEVDGEVKLKLVHYIRDDLDVEAMFVELQQVSTMNFSWSYNAVNQRQILEFEGQISSEEVRGIAERLYPRIAEFLNMQKVQWLKNYDGMNQLVFLNFLFETYFN